MKTIRTLLLMIAFTTLENVKAQDNLIGIYLSDQIKFPGMNVYFNDETWISGQYEIHASRNYSRFSTGLFYQYSVNRDWVLSFKAGMGVRKLHEFYNFDIVQAQPSGSTVTTLDYDGTYVQKSYSFLPGLYYKIDNNTRITGYGGVELLFNYYGKGTQHWINDDQIVNTYDPGDSIPGAPLTVTTQTFYRDSKAEFSPGMAIGIGFVAGLKVRVTDRIYAGIDISEYFSYLRFSGRATYEFTQEDHSTTTSDGNLTSESYTTHMEKIEYSDRTLSQFSFSNVVANLNVSFAF